MSVRDRLPVLIGTKRYEAQVEGITFQPLGNIAVVQDTQADPSEVSIENDGLWKRTGEDWSLGHGQEYFDLRTDRRPSVRERFRWSRGLDVFTNRRQASLLPAVTVSTTQTQSTVGAIKRKEDRLYVFEDDAVVYSDANDPTAWNTGTDTFAASGLKGPHSVAVAGGVMYVADGASIWDDTTSLGNFTNEFSTEDTDYLIGGSGRLIGLHDNDMYELTAAGAKRDATDIFSHIFSGFSFKGGLATNNGIYAFGDDGTRSEIYFMVPVDAGGELPPPYIAHNDLEDGELVRVLRTFGGLVIMGTSAGLRLCSIAGNGTLTSGPLIEIGDVQDLHFQGRYAYATSSTIKDQAGTVDDCGLYIFDLAEFTSPLVPAYATHLLSGTTGTAFAVGRLNEQLVWVQSSNSNNEIYVEHATNKVATFRLETGGLTFGVAEKVALSSVEAQFDPLEAGTSLGLELRERKGGTARVLQTEDADDLTELIHRFDGDDVLEEPEISIVGTRGATTTADVVLRRWTVRALPMLRRAQEVIIPLVLADQVTDQGDVGATVRMTPLTEFEYLRGLIKDRAIVDVEIGNQAFRARVEGLLIAPGRTTSGFTKWQDAGRNAWLEGTVGVRLITLQDDGNEAN